MRNYSNDNQSLCREIPYACVGDPGNCIKSAGVASGDPLDKYTCDGCHITTQVDRTECKRCKANIPSDASTSSTLPSRIDDSPKQKGTLIEMVKM